MGSAEGANDAKEDEKPGHAVHLPEYLIGKHPVTVAQYRLFVQATGYPETGSEAIGGEYEDHPVVCVDWPAALAFCETSILLRHCTLVCTIVYSNSADGVGPDGVIAGLTKGLWKRW
jgi:hypothetical protein